MVDDKINWDSYQVHNIFGDPALGVFHGPGIGDIAVLTIGKKARFDIKIDKIDGENFLGTLMSVSTGITPVLKFDGLQRGQALKFVHQNVCTFERRVPSSEATPNPKN